MKTLLTALLLILLLTPARAADTTVQALPNLAAPGDSAVFYIEDPDQATQGRSYLFTNLTTVADVSAATNSAYTSAQAFVNGLTNTVVLMSTNSAKSYADATFVLPATLTTATNNSYTSAQAFANSLTNTVVLMSTNSAKSYADAAFEPLLPADAAGALTNSGAGALGWFDLSIFAPLADPVFTGTATFDSFNATTLTADNWVLPVASTNVLVGVGGATNPVVATATMVTNSLGMNLQGELDAKLDEAAASALYQATNSTLTLLSALPATWTAVTPDTTNSVINLASAFPGIDKNFYYAITTSNYVIFSNLVAGAQGTIWVNASGTPQEVNFSSSYDNFSTNEIAPVFTITNRAIIAYKIGWGTDATNVMLGIKRK